MELLNVLEKKVLNLVDLVRRLQQENGILCAERTKLKDQMEAFEHSLLTRDQYDEEKGRELAHAKSIVDELIRNIDLVCEQQPSAQQSSVKHELPSS